MISHEDELDLEVEIYKLNGVNTLLSALAKECNNFETTIISDSLNDITKNINKIME